SRATRRVPSRRPRRRDRPGSRRRLPGRRRQVGCRHDDPPGLRPRPGRQPRRAHPAVSAVPSDGHRSVRERLRRRAVTVPALVAAAGVLTMSAPIWFPVAVVVDGIRGRFRFPIARLLAFGVCWTWIEIAGVTRAGATFLVGRAHHAPTQYALMKWWA